MVFLWTISVFVFSSTHFYIERCSNECEILENINISVTFLFFTQLWSKYTFSEWKFAVESKSALQICVWGRVKML